MIVNWIFQAAQGCAAAMGAAICPPSKSDEDEVRIFGFGFAPLRFSSKHPQTSMSA
jgi:hypothetical protein